MINYLMKFKKSSALCSISASKPYSFQKLHCTILWIITSKVGMSTRAARKVNNEYILQYNRYTFQWCLMVRLCYSPYYGEEETLIQMSY